MKVLMLFLLFIAFSSTSAFAQSSACNCKAVLGDGCEIRCPKGTKPDCTTTWYGGCSCSCNDILRESELGENDIDFNLNHLYFLNQFLDKNEKTVLNSLINELNLKLEKGNGHIVFIKQKKAEKVNSILTNLFNTLDYQDQIKVYHKVEG